MLRYLSEQVKAGLEPWIILAQLNVCGAKLWQTIDVKSILNIYVTGLYRK